MQQTFAPPPILRGTEGQQLMQLRQYLYQISRDLNGALGSLTECNFAPGSAAAKLLSGGMTEEQEQRLERGLGGLKSLIIKTADTVQAEMDVLETALRSSYVAVSDYGTYQEQIEGRLSATAEKIEQMLAYEAALSDALGGVSEAFDAYTVGVQGYIRQGIIGYDGAVPVIGIAIGRDLTITGATETVDGVEYEVIDTSSNMSVWTPDKLAFYINGEEAAYFSNGALYVGNIIVTGKLFLGQNQWEVSYNNGFTVKWIGD